MLFKVKLLFLYLKYLLVAKTRHGIHSPFVYKLVEDVVLKQANSTSSAYLIENCRKKLVKDKSIVNVNDLGAGSLVTSSAARAVKEIARHSLKNKKYAGLMYRLVEYFKPETILELGTSLGITTSYMAVANRNSKIISIEGSEAIARIAINNFVNLNITNVEVVIGSFDEKINDCVGNLKKLDFVFIDGNHREYATLTYFEQCLRASHNDTVFVFDDIRWSNGMMDAWEKIKNHKEVTVTADLFFMGLVFIRKDQAKEHFIIRY